MPTARKGGDKLRGHGATTPQSRLRWIGEHFENFQRNGMGWKATCPAHDDAEPSLSIAEGKDGRILIHCHASCPTAALLEVVGLRMSDLMPGAKQIVTTYDYQDEQGTLLYQSVRFNPKEFRQRRPDGNGSWIWNLDGVRRVPYRLAELVKADRKQLVFVVEGEKDCDNLSKLGLVATTNPGGAGKWKSAYNVSLRGRHVVVLPDNDDPGRKHAKQVAASLKGVAAGIKVVELPGLPEKGDVSDWLDAGGTRDKLLSLVKQTPTAGGNDGAAGRVSRDSRVRRDFSGGSPVGQVAEFLKKYVVLPDDSLLVLAVWVVAAWLADVWDRFPHLAVTSPEKRCGKTLLLELLFLIAPRPRYTTNISPAALYRVVEAERPTLLMDESQSISRRGSEASEVIREILNAGIGRNARVTRCAGERHDQIVEFTVYSPKVFAMIGEPDGVLADRCLPIPMKRKTAADVVMPFRFRVVGPIGEEIRDKLEKWAESNRKNVTEVYDKLEPFAIQNDRMAELLLPLQAVLTVAGGERPLELLRQYALKLDERDREQEMQSPGVRLLALCRELFSKGVTFMPTDTLIQSLVNRREEPWYRWNKGEPITREALANLLRRYGIKSERDKKQKARGCFACRFEEAWKCYLPLPLKNSANPPNSAKPASGPKTLVDCLRARGVGQVAK